MAEVATTADLAEVLGEISETVKVRGRDRKVTPLRVRQFVEVLQQIDKLVEAGVIEVRELVPAGGDAAAGPDLGRVVEQLRRRFDPVKMFLRGGTPFIRIVAICSGLAPSAVEDLDLADMTRLSATCLKVNLDFFDRHGSEIIESLGPVWGTITAALKGAQDGSAPSPDSSTAATD